MAEGYNLGVLVHRIDNKSTATQVAFFVCYA